MKKRRKGRQNVENKGLEREEKGYYKKKKVDWGKSTFR